MPRTHNYELTVSWTPDDDTGTADLLSYSRAHEVVMPGRRPLLASADAAHNGDPARWNPEEMLVAALSQCHMLWFLHLCANEGVVVVRYTDNPRGVMVETRDGGSFTEVVLRPSAAVTQESMVDKATSLHDTAHSMCFIASSVNFPVRHEPIISVA